VLRAWRLRPRDSLRVSTTSYVHAVLVPGSGGCGVHAICTPHGCICALFLALHVRVLRRCTLACAPRRRDALWLHALSPLFCANAMPDSFTCGVSQSKMRCDFAHIRLLHGVINSHPRTGRPRSLHLTSASHAPHVHPWLRFNSTRSTLEAVAALWRALS
jgi:hypothetical protein